jgi:hypothetical protein
MVSIPLYVEIAYDTIVLIPFYLVVLPFKEVSWIEYVSENQLDKKFNFFVTFVF